MTNEHPYHVTHPQTNIFYHSKYLHWLFQLQCSLLPSAHLSVHLYNTFECNILKIETYNNNTPENVVEGRVIADTMRLGGGVRFI